MDYRTTFSDISMPILVVVGRYISHYGTVDLKQ